MQESFLDRRERLRGEGKVELPLNIDSKKYLLSNISYMDLLVISPFMVVSFILIMVFHNTLGLSQGTIIISILPTLIVGMFQIIKHPIRKNISFIQFRVLWKLNYNKRIKQFNYQKGEMDMSNDSDVRKRLGIKSVYSGTYETSDNNFVKVIQVSSINLSLMSMKEQKDVFDGYRTFINELNTKSIQISQIAQPVNLAQYLLFIDLKTEEEEDIAKRMLKRSYKNYIENIQKSRNMVKRERYIIISTPIGSDREKSLQEVERTSLIIQSKIDNMLHGSARLSSEILQNNELIKLIYTCLDYENAQNQGDYIVDRANNKMNITLGEDSAQEIIDMFEKKLSETIN